MERKNSTSENLEDSVIVAERTLLYERDTTDREKKILIRIGKDVFDSLYFEDKDMLRTIDWQRYCKRYKITIGYDSGLNRGQAVKDVSIEPFYYGDRIEKLEFKKELLNKFEELEADQFGTTFVYKKSRINVSYCTQHKYTLENTDPNIMLT